MPMLVTPEYVAAVTGADISDTQRVELLIGEASRLVEEYLGMRFTADDAPTAVRQAVAILVAGALSGGGGAPGGGDGDVKAEQIGDYRVEYAGVGQYAPGLDLRRVLWLLTPLRGEGRRAVRTDVPLEGVAGGRGHDPWPDGLDATVVVNRW